jgi:hypothetical protein
MVASTPAGCTLLLSGFSDDGDGGTLNRCPPAAFYTRNERASDVEALSSCGSQRRRSESNRRMEVLQTSALPLGYGAET